jgi:hypothetical protein
VSVGSRRVEMYLLPMEKVAREDIAAAAAARHELGSGYDDVIAESLIERIGAEIDKRVDARLDSRRGARRIGAAELERRRTMWKGAVLGAAASGLPAIMVSLASPYSTKGVIIIVILTWLLVGAGYGIATWANSLRQRD